MTTRIPSDPTAGCVFFRDPDGRLWTSIGAFLYDDAIQRHGRYVAPVSARAYDAGCRPHQETAVYDWGDGWTAIQGALLTDVSEPTGGEMLDYDATHTGRAELDGHVDIVMVAVRYEGGRTNEATGLPRNYTMGVYRDHDLVWLDGLWVEVSLLVASDWRRMRDDAHRRGRADAYAHLRGQGLLSRLVWAVFPGLGMHT